MTGKNKKNIKNHYGKDFLTGCLALALIIVVIFILMPFLLFIVKLSLIIVAPIIGILLLVIFIILFGHIINSIFKKGVKCKKSGRMNTNDEEPIIIETVEEDTKDGDQ